MRAAMLQEQFSTCPKLYLLADVSACCRAHVKPYPGAAWTPTCKDRSANCCLWERPQASAGRDRPSLTFHAGIRSEGRAGQCKSKPGAALSDRRGSTFPPASPQAPAAQGSAPQPSRGCGSTSGSLQQQSQLKRFLLHPTSPVQTSPVSSGLLEAGDS